MQVAQLGEYLGELAGKKLSKLKDVANQGVQLHFLQHLLSEE